jgi:NADH-quinone oxidoreductase subunit H
VYRDGIEVAFGDTVLFQSAMSHGLVVVIGALGFVFKIVLLCFIQITIRWTLPRFRYDQLMRLGWRKLLPASLGNILVTGLVILAIQSAGPAVQRGLVSAGDLTMAFVALVGAGTFVYLVYFLLQPAEKRRLTVSSSARFAQQLGGTRAAKMEA